MSNARPLACTAGFDRPWYSLGNGLGRWVADGVLDALGESVDEVSPGLEEGPGRSVSRLASGPELVYPFWPGNGDRSHLS